MSEEEKALPSFSVIVPTYGDFEGLGRTLVNMVYQNEEGRPVQREILVIGDGYEEEAMKMCMDSNEFAKKQNQAARVWYFHTKGHSGNGNLPRAAGLKRARKDWVIFIDAGTSVTHDCFHILSIGGAERPNLQLMTWDMVQLTDPVPVVTTVYAVDKVDRSNGLPYVLPGCATAVKRELAQSVDWPDTRASDWAYFSTIWEKAFGLPEDKAKVEEGILLIPKTLTVAYGARTKRKSRMPSTLEEFNKQGYGMGFAKAAREIGEPKEEPNGDNTNTTAAV